jgi:nucleoside triphosphate diphosphatase
MDAPDPMSRLLAVMARLRAPDGCPWDQAQSFATIAPYTIEEAYEVADVIAHGPEPERLKDELGDLLLQVVYHARMAEERGWFAFGDVAEAIAAKMVRRHPHVFGDADAAQASETWEAQKAEERAARAETGVLAGVPSALPALTRAEKLTKRAARVGFDWPDAEAVLEKLAEEVAELRAELAAEKLQEERLLDETGDVLFVVANLARKLRIDPERALFAANEKFARRFAMVEQALVSEGKSPADSTLAEMEALWVRAKAAERA